MKQYYYSDGQQQIGPISKEDLKLKGITKETLVWCEGLSNWSKAGDVEDLADLFPKVPTPPPMPEQKMVTPPPMPKQKTPPPPPAQNTNTQAVPKNEGEVIRKGTTKKMLIGGIFAGVVFFLIIGLLIARNNKRNTINAERGCPVCYLSMRNESFVDANTMTGIIRNSSKYTSYRQVKLEFVYYDKNDEVLQSNTYILDGTYYPNDSNFFKVDIQNPQGIYKKLKWNTWNVKIIDAIPYNY